MGNVVRLPQNQAMGISDILEELTNLIKDLESKNKALQKENSRLKEINPFTKMFDELPDVLTAQHIADYLHISRYTAYEYLKISPNHGGLPSFETGRSVRCMKSDFADWLIKQKEQKAHGVRKQTREK